jgi:uncharacterized protein YcbK (DUF882 family)
MGHQNTIPPHFLPSRTIGVIEIDCFGSFPGCGNQLVLPKRCVGGAIRKRRRGTGLSARRSRTATGEWRIVVPIALFSALLAGCTTSGENSFGLANPSFTAGSAGVVAGDNAAPPAVNGEIPESATGEAVAAASAGAAAPTATVMDAGDTALPATVAYVPTSNPVAASVFPPVPVMAEANAASTAAVAEISADDAAAAGPAKPAEQQVASAATAPAPQFFLSAGDPAPQPAPPKKRGFLSNLFSTAEAAPMKAGIAQAYAPRPQAEKPAKPLVELASVDPDEARPVRASVGDGNDLPGVRKTALFEIKRKSGLDDDSDVDLHEEDELGGGAGYQVASAAGLARLAPNGLLKQTDKVDVGCLKPTLVRVLKAVEAHYGRKMVVTSGYRSATHNRRVRGAKNSMHMYCAAADVQVPGVTKWELAAFVRTMQGRGGVGTYCHTESVHIDVGPERDWNWRCRGKRKKRA